MTCFVALFQLGIALGFVVPASIVRSDKSEEAVELVGGDLYNMFLGVAVFTTALFIVILLGTKFVPTKCWGVGGLQGSETLFYLSATRGNLDKGTSDCSDSIFYPRRSRQV